MPTREFHIVGGLHPKLRLSYYTDMIRGLKERHPDVHIKALTAVEIAHLARIEKISEREVLLALQGGRPHQPARRRRRGVQHRGARHDRRAEADRRGVDPGAPRGARARDPDQLHHALRSRRDGGRPDRAPQRCCATLQDETGGFLTYIPLAYHPDHNELGEELGRVGTATTGYEDLKNIAVGAALPRQHPARQDPLADGDAVPVADRAQLRLRRRRGNGGLRADLSRGRRAHRRCTCRISSWCGSFAGPGSGRSSGTVSTSRCASSSTTRRLSHRSGVRPCTRFQCVHAA